MAAYPWIVLHKRQQMDLGTFPNLKRWFETIRARPAVVRAYEVGKRVTEAPEITEEAKAILFGQGRRPG